MKKIVITGGAGFIGSHIVEKCSSTYKNAEIVIFDNVGADETRAARDNDFFHAAALMLLVF